MWVKENLPSKSLIAQISAEDLDSETFGSKGIRLVHWNNDVMIAKTKHDNPCNIVEFQI